MTNRKPQITPSVDSTEARKGFDEIKDAGRDMARSLEQAGTQASKGVNKIGEGSQESAGKLDRSTKSIIGSIERTTAAMKAGERGTASYFETLAKQRGVSTDALKPYLDQLRQAEAAQKIASGSLDRMGVSAAQTAAALRGVPAQFTDIVTALQGGQQPLTVFLQQGGQLKDMFGGAGNAARALGGYVVGLINPFTLAAAGAGALALGYYKGAQEAQEFNKTLILTGNAAGVTAGQLSQMAAAVGSLSGATQGRAAEVLNQMAASARVGAENLQRFTAAAIQLERAGGPAAQETAKAFADMAKSPLESALKLDEATNFLTRSTYEQIKALEEQGNKTEAAKVAQEAYYRAATERAPELVENLSLVERAWLGIKDASNAALDQLNEIGRADSLGDLERKLANAEARLRDAGPAGLLAILAERNVVELRSQVALAREGESWLRAWAAAEGKKNEQKRAGIAFDREAEKYLSSHARMQRELNAAVTEGVKAEKSVAEIVALVYAIREKYATKAKADNSIQREAEQQARLFAELAGLSNEFQQEWDLLNKAFAQGKINLDQLTESQAKLIAKQPFAREQAKELAEANKQAAKAYEEVTKSYERQVEQLQKSASGVADQVQKLKDEEAAALLAAAGNISLAQAIQQVTIARLQEQQAAEAKAGNQEAVDAIEKEIKARRELIGLIGNKEARDAAKKAADKAADEWKKASDKIEDAITDSLMRGFESGKGFAENLRDTVENMFKTMVLRPIISAIVQPVAQQLTGSMGLVNSAANAYGMVSGASSLSLMAANATGAVGGDALGSLIASNAGNWGVSSAGVTAGSSLLGSAATAVPYLAAAYAIYSIAKSLDDSGTMHTGASSQYSAAAGLSTGMGVYGVGSKAGSYGVATEAMTTQVTQSIVGILDSTASTFGKQAGYAAAAGFADDTSKDGAWGSLSIKIGEKVIEGFGQDGNGRWPGQSFSDGQAGTQEYLAAVSADVRNALDQIGLPDWASGMLDKLGDAPSLDQLAATVAQINATQAALVSMGEVMPQLSGLTDAAVNSLLSSFGSIDQLASSAQSYYENFYSQAERSAETTRQISEALGDLGLTMPATREAFRSLVESQDLTTEAGQKTYAALLKLSPAFASVVAETKALTDSVDETAAAIAKAAEEMAEAGRRALASLAEDQGSLLVQLLNAQGKGAEASALERQQALARITAGLSETDKAAATAAYDYNQALRDQITALLAATDAQKQAEAAAKQAADAAIAEAQARAQAIAAEGYGLETRLLQAQGKMQELRDRELASLDQSNRAILEHIFSLEDKKAADDEAARAVLEASQAQQRAADDAKRLAESIASEGYGLTTKLLQAQGNTAELRRRELEALAPANRAILEQIFAIEDKKAADEAAARAAADAASAQQRAAEESERAAERIRDAWQSVADSLFDEVSRIRGLIQQDSGASYATMAARFGITTAQARAGDQEAAKLLPSLSQTMLTLAEAQATSLAELQRIRAQTAASLESTGSILASQFGLTIPKLDTGTNYVPRDMLAVIHRGEAVVPAAYNPASGGSSNAELVSEIRGLREEAKVQQLRLIQLSAELNRVVKTWDANGLPTERVEA